MYSNCSKVPTVLTYLVQRGSLKICKLLFLNAFAFILTLKIYLAILHVEFFKWLQYEFFISCNMVSAFSPFYTFLKVFQSIPSLPIVIFINLVFSSPFYFYLIYQVNLWLVALDFNWVNRVKISINLNFSGAMVGTFEVEINVTLSY